MSPIRFRLADLRGEMSQSELARRAGVRRATIVEMEGGKASRVSLEVLERIADALGVEPGELLEREAKKARTPKSRG